MSPTNSAVPCPSCASTDSVPIVYGLLDFETFLQSPGIIPGGCCVQPEDRECRQCATRFCGDGTVGD
jgi:hypothetical protein